MKAERQQKECTSRVVQPSKGGGGRIVDNRPQSRDQTKIVNAIQKHENKSIFRNNLESEQNNNYLNNKESNQTSVVQGYFIYEGKPIPDKLSEGLHGWAHANLQGSSRIKFFQIYQDKTTPVEITQWFGEKGMTFKEVFFNHLSHYEMGMLSVRRSELIFEITHTMFYDCIQSTIPGMKKLVDDIAHVDITRPTAYAFLEGYSFQVKQIIAEAQKSRYLETEQGDILKEKVKKVESEYTDHTGTSRWADMEVVDSDDEDKSAYIEVKSVSSTYDPDVETKRSFESQALAYSKCGKKVTYVFKNDPPQWIKSILARLKLKFIIA